MSTAEMPWRLEVLGEYARYYETRQEAEQSRHWLVNNLVIELLKVCPSTSADLIGQTLMSCFTIKSLWESE